MAKNDTASIFREKALRRLSSPDQLDQLLPVVKPKTWIALVTTLLLVVGVIIWSFVGEITTIASGEGIYLDFSMLHSITIPTEGRVLEMTVTLGEKVKEGQVIATIWDQKNQKKVEVISPFAGIIVDLFAAAGAPATLDAVLANIQHHEKSASLKDRFYCFFPAKKADKIKEGMLAKISPWSVERGVYGEILGRVEKISYLPASSYYFKSIFLNETYANRLTETAALIPIVINPDEEPDKPWNFQWTSGKGPSKQEVALGSFATVEVVLDSRPPISYVFPFWYMKKLEEETFKTQDEN